MFSLYHFNPFLISTIFVHWNIVVHVRVCCCPCLHRWQIGWLVVGCVFFSHTHTHTNIIFFLFFSNCFDSFIYHESEKKFTCFKYRATNILYIQTMLITTTNNNNTFLVTKLMMIDPRKKKSITMRKCVYISFKNVFWLLIDLLLFCWSKMNGFVFSGISSSFWEPQRFIQS